MIVNDAHPGVGLLDHLENLIGANLLLDGSHKEILALAELLESTAPMS